MRTPLQLLPAALLAARGGQLRDDAPERAGGRARRGGPGAAERWGVEPLAVRVSAAGYMLDFRLRVVDPEKAAPLLVRKADWHVVAEKSGGVLQVARSPKIGALRSSVRTESMVKKDRVYGALFANPGRFVAAGDEVTVIMGDLRVERLVVQ